LNLVYTVGEKLHIRVERLLVTFVKGRIEKHKESSPQDTYRSVWNVLQRSLTFRLLLALTPKHGPRRHFRSRTHGLLLKHIEGYRGSLHISVPENLRILIQKSDPFLAVTFHDGFSHLDKVLSENKRHYTRIASGKRWLERLSRQLDPGPYAHIVGDDALSLIAVRHAVEDGHAICAAIDYANRKGKKVYANPALIGFANRFKLGIVFVKTNVTQSGNVELICWGPFRDVKPEECVKMFIQLFNSVGVTRVKLAVRRYNETTDTRKRQGKGLTRRLQVS